MSKRRFHQRRFQPSKMPCKPRRAKKAHSGPILRELVESKDPVVRGRLRLGFLEDLMTGLGWTVSFQLSGRSVRYEMDCSEVFRRIRACVPEEDRLLAIDRYIDWVSCDRKLVDSEHPDAIVTWDHLDDLLNACGLVSRLDGSILVLTLPTKGGKAV